MAASYVIAIDPSVSSCGIARWRFTTWARWEKALPPEEVHLWHPPSKAKAWHEKMNWMARALDIYIAEADLPIHSVGCELPMMVRGGGEVVANSGALVKLSCCVGAFAGVCAMHDVEFVPVPVHDWKGQLPKTMVNRRIKKLLGAANCREFRADIWDAVGIGLYMKGVRF